MKLSLIPRLSPHASRFSVLQATESCVGPGNEAYETCTEENRGQICALATVRVFKPFLYSGVFNEHLQQEYEEDCLLSDPSPHAMIHTVH